MKIQRNESCPCKSGKKYKKCCLLVMVEDDIEIRCNQILYNDSFIYQVIPEVEDECADTLDRLDEDNNVNSAKKVAARLYKQYPNNHMVNFLKGVCCLRENKITDSIAYFETAIQIFPYFIEAFYNLGCVYLKEIRIREAVACFKRVLKIATATEDTFKLAKERLDSLEQMAEMSSGLSLDEYMQNNKVFDLAFACLKEKKYEEAIVLFQKVLSVDPNVVQACSNIALAYSALGRNKIALEYLDRAIYIDPEYAPALINKIEISRLAEDEKPIGAIREVVYYKDGMSGIRDLFR